MGEHKDALSEPCVTSRDQVAVAQDGVQQWDEPLVYSDLRRPQIVPGAPLRIAGVEITSDAPVSGDLFLERERFRQTVVSASLSRGLQPGDDLEKLRRQEAAFDPDGRKPLVSSCACHLSPQRLTMGMKT